MDVSIIILTYNQEGTIGRTIDSILAQRTMCTYEIIIGDDCSQDKTRSICIQYQQRHPDVISVIEEHENYGVTKNYATCVSRCSGKYIMECAGDDWWSNNNKMQMQFDFMERHPEYVMCYSGYDEYHVKNGEVITCKPSRLEVPIFKSLLKSIPICAPSICIRKEALDKISFEDFIKEGFWCEDHPLFLALSLQGDFGIIEDALVTYTVQSGSLDHYRSFEKKLAQIENDDKIREYFINNTPCPREYFSLCRDISNRLKATACVSYNHRKEALGYYKAIKKKTKYDLIKMLICESNILFNLYHRRLLKLSHIV